MRVPKCAAIFICCICIGISCTLPMFHIPKRTDAAKPVPESPAKTYTSQNGAEIIEKKRFIDYAKLQEQEQQLITIPMRKREEVLLPGDQLEITLYEKLPVSQEKRIELKRIDETGEIFLYPLGTLSLAGQTLGRARQSIERAMAGYIVTPLCEITLVKRDYEPHVFVFGEAIKPGSFPLKSGDRLLDVISSAGGTTSAAYMASVKLVRLTGDSIRVMSIDLGAILKKGQIENNISLQDQDIVFIPTDLLSNVTEVLSKLGAIVPWYYFIKNF